MPLYEYQCVECRRRVEKIQKFSDPPLTVCEECGGKLKRLLSSPAIQFKGSGWYVTDYGGKSSHSSSATSDGPSNGSGKKPAESATKQAPAKTGTSKD